VKYAAVEKSFVVDAGVSGVEPFKSKRVRPFDKSTTQAETWDAR
jgi:hypothetical protein